MNISDCDAVILCGGLGTRIRDMLEPGQPKCMANINGRPFIRILISHLRQRGFEKFTLCVGYGQDKTIESVTKDEFAVFFCEHEQFGTGGALRLMLRSPAIKLSNPFFVFNGDTYFGELSFEHMLRFYTLYRPIITSCKYQGKFVGVFVTDWRMKEFLEWEHREKFDMGDLPLHAHSKILHVDTPFLDIGTPEGLRIARERFK